MKTTYKLIIRIICFIGCLSKCVSFNLPKVRVDHGEIVGGYDYTYHGRRLYSFLGIPYANPPTQNNRFKEPQPLKPWLGVWNATITGSGCLRPHKFIRYSFVGQEDCLYLNVYTPKLPDDDIEVSSDLMNVVVFIHGGAFVGGESIKYGPHYLLDRNDFVYVSINYRLGVLGFANTNDGIIPGNNGMKDQVAALKWIHENIEYFYGNPDHVTITGLSAGSSSVHYHLLSPMSAGLFHKAILQSGSAYCHWAYTENVVQKTRYVAEILGCPTKNSESMVNCLRGRPGNAIAESIKHFMHWSYHPFSPFGPTKELFGKERFLPDIPEKLIPYDVPVLMSITKDEGLFIAALKSDINEINDSWNTILPYLLDYDNTISNKALKNKVAQDIKEFYFGKKSVSMKTKKNLVKMVSDRMFGYAISKAAQSIASKNTAPVYFHEFGYSGEYSTMTDINRKSYFKGSGVSHGDETIYILKTDNKTPHMNDEEENIIEKMVNIWASFINKGVPDIGNLVTWLPVSKNPTDPLRFIKITQNQTFESKELYNHGNYTFWRSLPLNEFYEPMVSEKTIHTEL